jgi:hypothetical protein
MKTQATNTPNTSTAAAPAPEAGAAASNGKPVTKSGRVVAEPESDNMSLADLAAGFTTKRAAATTAATGGKGGKGNKGATAQAAAEVETTEEEPVQGEEEQPETETEVEATSEANETEGEGTETTQGEEGQEGEGEGSETEGEDEGEEQPATAKELEKKLRKAAKRIDKLTARLREAEAGANAPANGETEQRPSGDQVLAQLESNLAVLENALTWVDENPEGGEYTDEKGNKREFTAAEARKIRRNAEYQRTELLTAKAARKQAVQAAYAKEQTTAQKEFERAYAELADEDSETPQAVEYRQTIQMAAPALKQFPDYKLWIADAIAGRAARLAKVAKTNGTNGKPGVRALGAPMTRPKGSTEPPNVVTRPAAGATRVDAKQKAVQDAEKDFAKSGSTEDLANLFSRKKQARLQPA